MYISEDTILLLILIIGLWIFGFVMSSNRGVAWQNKTYDDFVLFCEFIAVLLLVALVIYLIFFKEW